MLESENIERSLIASIAFAIDYDVCKGLALKAVSDLTIEHFSTDNTREIFRGVKNCIAKNVAPDIANLDHHVGDAAKEYLYGLAKVSTSASIDYFLESLRDTAKARKLIKASHNTYNLLTGSEDTREALEKAERDIMSVFNESVHKFSDEGYIGDYMPEWFEEKQKMMSSDGITGLTTGFKTLDNILGGFRPGELITVAGRPGMGKSSFISTMVVKQMMQGYKPAIFSFELGRMEIADKIISMLTEFDESVDTVPYRNIFNPRGNFGGVGLSKKDLLSIGKITEKYLKNNMCYLRGASKTTVEEVLSRARMLHAEGNLDELVIDHIGLLVNDKNNAVAELTHITNSLKLFASELKIPVVEVSQLSRTADNTREKPRLSMLKGSGSIEEDSCIVIMPWRPFALHNDADKNPPYESSLILAKGRNAGTGEIQTIFSEQTTSFTEPVAVDNRYEEPEEEYF